MSRRDPLEPLRRIRRMAVDEAKAGLAGAMRGEDAAAARLALAGEVIRHETMAASALDGGCPGVGQFVLWLAGARSREREAAAAHCAAGLETASARCALGDARAAERAVETMQERQAATRAAAAARTEQAVLDEAGQEAGRRLRAARHAIRPEMAGG
jgi:flagellar export protein FliJ